MTLTFDTAIKMIQAGLTTSRLIVSAVRGFTTKVTDDAGNPIDAAALDAKFSAWEAQQIQTGANAASRIDERHKGDT